MIKVISFDLDGTLVEENFDKIIWYDLIPKLYAKKYRLSVNEAKKKVYSEYKKGLQEKDTRIRWTDIEYWFGRLGLKGWKSAIKSLKGDIKIYPEVIPTLSKLKRDHKLILVTHSHKHFLEVKLKIENLRDYFSKIYSMPFRGKDVKGYRKIIKELKITSSEIMHFGDDWNHDYLYPRRAGIKSYFLDRTGKKKGKCVIHSLNALDKLIK